MRPLRFEERGILLVKAPGANCGQGRATEDERTGGEGSERRMWFLQ